jgi:hypothetical protein
MIEVRNPVASGKLVVVEKVTLSSVSGASLVARRGGVNGLANLYGPCIAKYIGGVNSTAQIRTMHADANTSPAPTRGANAFILTIAAGAQIDLPLSSPMVLPAGEGFCMGTFNNQHLRATFNILELPG